jgi:hypothetical protein
MSKIAEKGFHFKEKTGFHIALSSGLGFASSETNLSRKNSQ